MFSSHLFSGGWKKKKSLVYFLFLNIYIYLFISCEPNLLERESIYLLFFFLFMSIASEDDSHSFVVVLVRDYFKKIKKNLL